MRKKQRAITPDVELEAAVQNALKRGITLTAICAKAEVNQATLFKWRHQYTSPVMSVRQDVLDAIEALITEYELENIGNP